MHGLGLKHLLRPPTAFPNGHIGQGVLNEEAIHRDMMRKPSHVETGAAEVLLGRAGAPNWFDKERGCRPGTGRKANGLPSKAISCPDIFMEPSLSVSSLWFARAPIEL